MGRERDHGPIVEVDSRYYLMRAFNAINTLPWKVQFDYHGVLFWNEGEGFIFEYNGKQFLAGEIHDFDEFLDVLLSQKRHVS